MRPAVGPIALDYLAAALEQAGWQPSLLDLTWADDAEAAIARHFRDHEPVLVGYTQRNTDDCYLASRYSCLPHARAMIALIRRHTAAPIVVGGCGYSLAPVALLEELGADYGLAGEGEVALHRLATAIAKGEPPPTIPGLAYRADNEVRYNAWEPVELAGLPLSQRAFLDNARYWREGGQGGFETKRGCDRGCIYCADPIVKGRRIRLRDPRDVAQEVANLAQQGVLHLHTCDSEFNVPREHAVAVCEALIERNLGETVRWYAYCTPGDFEAELAENMKRAGCVGIDFGADNGADAQLARLGRDFGVEDLERAARLCHEHGIAFMFDLLLGAPGETQETVRRTIELMKRLEPSRVGVSAGVRLYPGTKLSARLARGTLDERDGFRGELEDNDDLVQPVFYVSPELGPDVHRYVSNLVGNDPRFFCADPEAELTDYNYRENLTLVNAIREGHRGAYWDILRRLEEGLPPA